MQITFNPKYNRPQISVAFRVYIFKIKDDVERGHVNLKGSCKRCKSCRFKLKYYYNIKMFIIIGLLLLVSYVLVKNTI